MAKENSDFEFLVPAGFEWDEDKSKANLIKHGLDFEDAQEVFTGQLSSEDQTATARRDGSQSENPTIESCR